MKQFVLSALMALVTITGQACGWYWDEEQEYYSLLNQCWYLSDPELAPFLYKGGQPYHSDCGTSNPSYYSDNLSEWKSFFEDAYSTEEIRECLYGMTLEDFEPIRAGRVPDGTLTNNALVKALAKGKHKEYLKYLEYALQCGPYVSGLYDYRWGQVERDQDANLEMVTVGKKLCKTTKSEVLKVRYAYQMIRLAHYAYSYDYALDIYEQYAVPHMQHAGSFKYYIADQMGGVYRGLGRISEALTNFIEVYIHSDDRRQGTLNSIHMTRNIDWDDMEEWKNREEGLSEEQRIYSHLIASMNGYSLGELREVLKIDPSHPVAEALVMRVLKEAEREAHDKYNKDLLARDEDVAELIELFKSYQGQFPDNGFYSFAMGYAHFLDGNYEASEKTFESLIQNAGKSGMYQDSLQNFARLAHLASMDRIGETEEAWLFSNPLEGKHKKLGKRLLGHKYLEQQDTVKAFLCARSSDYFMERFDLVLMAKVEAFHLQKSKNAWEMKLDERIDPKDFARARGQYHLRRGELKEAITQLEQGNFALRDNNRKLFVSNLMDYIWDEYQEFNHGYESYEGHKELSKIPELGNYLDLARYLQKLEQRAQKGKDVAICYEMLGSAYYNLTTYGYCRHYINSNYPEVTSSAHQARIIPEYDFEKCEVHQKGVVHEDYGNLFGYWFYGGTGFPFNDPMVAHNYYAKALEATPKSERENRARLTFALAKCQQVLDFQGEELELDGEIRASKEYFKELIEEYQNTDYYEKAYNSCTYLEDYYNANYR